MTSYLKDAGRELIVHFAREAICIHDRRYWLDELGYESDLEPVCRRLLEIIGGTYPTMTAEWVQDRQARIDRAIGGASRPPNPDDILPF